MADAVKALTHWRRGRDVVRTDHTREVVRHELPDEAKAAIVKLAAELDANRVRIQRLEAVIARLAVEASREA